MRELTKSMMSYGWAMSMYGVQQMANMLSSQGGGMGKKAAESFDHVTSAAVNELGGSLKDAFRAGDKMQSDMVDMMFGGCGAFDPNRMMKMGSDMMQQTADSAMRAAQGTAAAAGQAAQAATTPPPPGATGGPYGTAGSQTRPNQPGGSTGAGWGPIPR